METKRTLGTSGILGVLCAALLAGCTIGQDDADPTMLVHGDYKSLSLCLRGELRREEIGVFLTIDEASKRARIWRELPQQVVSDEEFSIFLSQTAQQQVGIAVRYPGLSISEDELLTRLEPLIERCSNRPDLAADPT